MLSGPDMGAGYLYQLSYDEEDDGVRSFAFHAQKGGVDAGGPPVGSIDFLGYAHPDRACMFGGPRCWERRFFLGEAALPRVRAAYQRTRFAMAAMLGHQYEALPVPFAAGLEEFLTRSDPPLRSAGIRYRVVGRGASWLRSGGEPPGSLTVELGAGGAELVGSALEPFLIEPVAARDPEEGTGGRAFLGTFKAGLRVEFGERPPGAGAAPPAQLEIPFAAFGVPVASTAPAGAPDNPEAAHRTVA
jgi:hypothetical protein